MLRNAAIPFVPEAAHLELVIIGRATLAKHAARDIIIGRLAPGLIADLAFLDRLDIVGGRKAAWAEEFGEVEEAKLAQPFRFLDRRERPGVDLDRKSTRLNSSH